MGLKVKYFQCQDWEAYDEEFKIRKYHEYPVKRENYIHVADFEFETAIGAEQCLWDLVYLFGTEDWYTNPKITVHVMTPLRHIQKTDVFTLVSFGQYSFGIKRNLDMMGMAFPFAGIVTSLGNCDAYLQAAQTGTATSGLSQLQSARGDVADSLGDNSITTTDFDATNTLAAALRTAEGNAPSTASSAYNGALTALDTYITTVTGSTIKEYWNSKTSDRTMTFTDNFRSFFRRVKADEVIVKLYSVTMPSAGATTVISSVGSTTNMIPALYEVRTDTAIGSSFVANFTCVKSGGSSDLVSLTIDAGTGISNYFSIGGTTKYLYISAFSGTGSDTNSISVWTR